MNVEKIIMMNGEKMMMIGEEKHFWGEKKIMIMILGIQRNKAYEII